MPFLHADPHARRPLPSNMRLMPSPPPPDAAARERFAKRRAAGLVAESLALAVGRSAAETGTARLAAVLAADAGVLVSEGQAMAGEESEPESPPAGRVTVVARNLRKRSSLAAAAAE